MWMLFFLTILTHASEPNKKIDWEAHEASLQFARNGYPTELKHAIWVPNKDGQELLGPSVPRQYRHMHAMVVSAFYSPRKDQRELSWKWLESYECENALGCEMFAEFFDGALKANTLTLKSRDRARFEKFRAGLFAKSKRLAKTLPKQSGLCGPESDRVGWLEMGYQLFCPPYSVGASDCATLGPKDTECSSNHALSFLLGNKSHQMIMSSSRLDGLRHLGAADCRQPWQVELVCGGSFELVHKLKCSRVGEGYPAKIHCERAPQP